MGRGYAPISCLRPARDRWMEGWGPGCRSLSESLGGDPGMLWQRLRVAETIGNSRRNGRECPDRFVPWPGKVDRSQ